jgi:molybdate transport system substrate-binding protein
MRHHVKTIVSVFVVMTALIHAPSQASASASTSPGTLTIFAASSLTTIFTSLGKAFEESHPGIKVQFSFLSSSTLATQLVAGAPADVFASASPIDMAMAGWRVPKSTVFVTNRVVLAVPRANPLRINKLKDLNKPNVKWIQCAHQVPCGVAADAALAAAGVVTTKPVSLEPKASSVLTKILAGEVDAAIVYHTDIVAHSKSLRGIAFENAQASTTKYLIGVVTENEHLAFSKMFVDFVLSVKGMKLLYQAGFGRVK